MLIRLKLYFQNGGGYKDIEEIEYKREQPLIWREDTNLINGTNGERPSGCRNSVQGKTLLVDDEGYVCMRNNLLSNGCCDPNENVQYTCDTCNMEEGCCAVYEKCVSCCLNPNKVGRLFEIKTRVFFIFNKLFFNLTLLPSIHSDQYSRKQWKWRPDDKPLCLPLSKINSSCAVPNVVPIPIAYNMKINTKIQRQNSATRISKRMNHSATIDQIVCFISVE